MAYSGFISDPSYCRKNKETTVSAKWIFDNDLEVNGSAKFKNTIQGVAMSALWGDLAEIYKADVNEVLIPGTLVKFGGEYEITKTTTNDKHYFGVVSTKPGVILNKKEKDGVVVALMGRVPVRVVGKIKKFDKLTISSVPGVAKKKTFLDWILLKPTIGVVLESKETLTESTLMSFVKSHF